jgi:Dolichyl-phosphate-mannose-protein mannosyltransferase
MSWMKNRDQAWKEQIMRDAKMRGLMAGTMKGMPSRGPVKFGRLDLALFLVGLVPLVGSLLFDWSDLLVQVGLPIRELSNAWVRADLKTLRVVCVVSASLLLLSRIAFWKYPETIARAYVGARAYLGTAARSPLFVPLSLTALVLAKTVLQLGLYFVGYATYGADDFARSLSADYWLYYRRFDLGWNGWLGLYGNGWLPFSDYLFGLALALHRDLYLTPRVVNLAISGTAVVAIYLLGRELFNRSVGLVTAALFAFQPWHVWLGMSGMTSDLPSVVLITVFGLLVVRWFRNDEPRHLLFASAVLATANGFRYENWLFSLVLSVAVLVIGIVRRKQKRLDMRWVIAGAFSLALINAIPVFWMAASYFVLGDWLPAMHGTNAAAALVGSMTEPASRAPAASSLVVNQAAYMPQINLLAFALGSFPAELALSIGGVTVLLRSGGKEPPRSYLLIVAATMAVFAIVFKGRLPASIVFGRILLAFIALLLPYAGFVLIELLTMRRPWRYQSAVASCLIMLITGFLDLSRAFNYPAVFPKDAIDAGWTIRSLQALGTIPPTGKILIERAQDWGDLGIVVLANRPERFVALNELGYRRLAALPGRPAVEPTAGGDVADGVRGTACDEGFQAAGCKDSLLGEGFSLLVLSSPAKITSFQSTFHTQFWAIGRYRLFDMTSVTSSQHAAVPSDAHGPPR